MKNEILFRLKKVTVYSLIALVVVSNISFIPIVQAGGGPTLIIGSQTAINGDSISVPITGEGFTTDPADITGLQFRVNYDNALLSFTGFTPATTGVTTINDVGDYVSILWDHSSALVLENETFVSLNFDVISDDTIDANLNLSNEVASNSSGDPVIVAFVDGVISLNPDTTAPSVSSYTLDGAEQNVVFNPNDPSSVSIVINTDEPVKFTRIKILNDESEEVKFFTESADFVTTATKIWDGKNTSDEVVTDGVYTLQVNIKDAADNTNNNLNLEPHTITVDTTAPVITLNGDNPTELTVGDTFTDPVTALDNIGGDITADVIKTGTFTDSSVAGTFTIIYDVSDAAGNAAAQATRTVNVNEVEEPQDTTPPVITLLGGATVNLLISDVYTDAGATASDDVDGNITANIVTVNSVNTAVIGTYTVTYNVSDAAGNAAAQVTRTVNVQAQSSIGGGAISNVTANSYDFAWNWPGDSTVQFILKQSTDNVQFDIVAQISAVADQTDYQYTFDGLEPNTDYWHSVEATDDNGTSGVGNVNPTITLASVPSNVQAVADSPTQITVSWSGDGTSYAVTNLNDNITQITNLTSQQFTDLTCNTEYTLSIGALNSEGATNPTETLASVFTQACPSQGGGGSATPAPDTTPPVITLLGSDSINLYVGAFYVDNGAIASDDVDGKISANIITVNPVNTNAAGTYIITYDVSDAAGNAAIQVTTTVNVLPVEPGQILIAENMTLNTSAYEVLIDDYQPSSANINVPAEVTNAQLNVSAVLNGSAIKSATILASLIINSNTGAGEINVQVPQEIQMSGDSSWTGKINLPQVRENSGVTVVPDSGHTAEVSEVIEIGFGSTSLNFDKAVRIEIAGQAGKYVGYSRNGVFTTIANACSDDTQTAGDALVESGDCKINAGSDLVVWTKHFTEFVVYTQTAIPAPAPVSSGGGGGGGGGGSSFVALGLSGAPIVGTIFPVVAAIPVAPAPPVRTVTPQVLGVRVFSEDVLLRVDQRSIYSVRGRTLYKIPNLAVLSRFASRDRLEVTAEDIVGYEIGSPIPATRPTYNARTLLRVNARDIYVVDNRTLHRVPNPRTLWPYRDFARLEVGDDALIEFTVGEVVPAL